MAVLEPKLAILDETDSGLDIDALRIVAAGVNRLRGPERAMLVVTHYQRLLDYIVPDFVHVLVDGPHRALRRQGDGARARGEGLRLAREGAGRGRREDASHERRERGEGRLPGGLRALRAVAGGARPSRRGSASGAPPPSRASWRRACRRRATRPGATRRIAPLTRGRFEPADPEARPAADVLVAAAGRRRRAGRGSCFVNGRLSRRAVAAGRGGVGRLGDEPEAGARVASREPRALAGAPGRGRATPASPSSTRALAERRGRGADRAGRGARARRSASSTSARAPSGSRRLRAHASSWRGAAASPGSSRCFASGGGRGLRSRTR